MPADKSVAIDEDIKGMMGMIDAALDDQKDVENAMDTLVTTVFEKLNNNSTKFSVLFKELSFGKLAYDLDKAKIEIPQDIVGIEQPLIKKLIEINVSCSEVIDELKEGIVDKDKRADFGDHIRKNFIEPSISTIAKLVSFGPDHPLVAQIAKFAELFTKQVDQLVSVLNQYELIYTLHQSDNKHAQFYSYDSIHGELHSADHKNRSGTRDRFVDNY